MADSNNNIGQQVSALLMDLCDQLSFGTITINQIPIQQLRSLVTQSCVSSDASIATPSSQLLIEQGFLLLSEAAASDNPATVILALQVIACWIMNFMEHDNAWAARYNTLNYNHSFFIHSQEAYSRYHARIHPSDNPALFSGRCVIYTAITGGYDELSEPKYINPSVDYICFTDNPSLASDTWQIRLVDNPMSLSPTRLARYYKFFPDRFLPDYDYSIWVDGKFQLTGDILELIPRFHQSSSLLCFPHYRRDCAYEEAATCIEAGIDDPDVIRAQMQCYKALGYPEYNGLTDTGVLIRAHHDEALKTVMQDWWNELSSGSFRDQLSFEFCCWKNHFTYDLCNLFLYSNPYLYAHGHRKKTDFI